MGTPGTLMAPKPGESLDAAGDRKRMWLALEQGERVKNKTLKELCKKIFLLVYQNLFEQNLGAIAPCHHSPLTVKHHRSHR